MAWSIVCRYPGIPVLVFALCAREISMMHGASRSTGMWQPKRYKSILFLRCQIEMKPSHGLRCNARDDRTSKLGHGRRPDISGRTSFLSTRRPSLYHGILFRRSSWRVKNVTGRNTLRTKRYRPSHPSPKMFVRNKDGRRLDKHSFAWSAIRMVSNADEQVMRRNMFVLAGFMAKRSLTCQAKEGYRTGNEILDA